MGLNRSTKGRIWVKNISSGCGGWRREADRSESETGNCCGQCREKRIVKVCTERWISGQRCFLCTLPLSINPVMLIELSSLSGSQFSFRSLRYIARKSFPITCHIKREQSVCTTDVRNISAASHGVEFLSQTSFGKFTSLYHGVVLLSYLVHVDHLQIVQPFP